MGNKITEMERYMLYGIIGVFIIYLVTPILYGYQIGDKEDNIFHATQKKMLFTGKNPFIRPLDDRSAGTPILYYFFPLDIITTEYLFLFLFIPILLYVLSGLFIEKREFRAFPPLIWVASRIPFLMLTSGLYTQIIAHFFVTLFVYFWIKRQYLPAIISAILVILGHVGSRYLMIAIGVFALLDLIRERFKGFPIVLSGHELSLENLSVHNHHTISDYIIMGMTFFGIQKLRNKESYSLLLLCILPAVLFTARGWWTLFFFATIALAVSIEYEPKKMILPLVFLALFVNSSIIGASMRGYMWNYENHNMLLEYHRQGNAYCYYYNASSWMYSEVTIRSWLVDDIPVTWCENERWKEAKMMEIDDNYWKTYQDLDEVYKDVIKR